MAGHSKWANIKYRKERQDKARGRIFSKLAKEITIAAKQGDPDPEKNPTLADAIERARAANMPKENIERAIKRATGELPGQAFEEVTYEGYGPDGVAVMVHVITDNRNRAASQIRRIFEDFGGSLGGSVAWMFRRRGLVRVDKAPLPDPEELMLAAMDLGAEDVEDQGETIEIYCDPGQLTPLRQGLEALGVAPEEARVTLVPQNTVRLEGPQAERILKFINRLDEHDDVQEVFANFDVPEELFERVG